MFLTRIEGVLKIRGWEPVRSWENRLGADTKGPLISRFIADFLLLSSETPWKIFNVVVYLLSCSCIPSWQLILSTHFVSGTLRKTGSSLWRAAQKNRALAHREPVTKQRYSSWHLWFRHPGPGQGSCNAHRGWMCFLWLQLWLRWKLEKIAEILEFWTRV